MVAELDNFSKSHLKWVNFVIRKLYLSKAVKDSKIMTCFEKHNVKMYICMYIYIYLQYELNLLNVISIIYHPPIYKYV